MILTHCVAGAAHALLVIFMYIKIMRAAFPICQRMNDLLDSSENRRVNSRLSCQIKFSQAIDGIAIAIAPEG
jgi:hypothetical protein